MTLKCNSHQHVLTVALSIVLLYEIIVVKKREWNPVQCENHIYEAEGLPGATAQLIVLWDGILQLWKVVMVTITSQDQLLNCPMTS